MTRETVSDLYRDSGSDGPARKPHWTPLRLLLTVTHLYRLRVREQPLQEVLALFGIAAGVALLFAVQVASTSITGSLGQLAHGVTGRATLEVAARGPDGMDQGFVAKTQRLKSVQGAAPLLQQRITVVGPAGSAPLTLVGVDDRLEKIGGPLVRRFFAERRDLNALGMFLTARAAKKIGAGVGQTLTIESAGLRRETILAGTLDADEIGGLAETPVALAPLGLAQRIAALPGRISRVLVEPKDGMGATGDLRELAGDRFDVRASDSEVKLLGEALKPDQQSSALFSAIAVGIGLLFAYNAMLLAVVRRRRLMAYLRMLGADRATMFATLVFDALLLGVVASVVGIALGELLSRVAFQSIPEYLAAGFAIGEQRVVEVQTVVLSFVGGLAAAILASAKPAIDLFRVDPAEAVHERVAARGGSRSLFSSKTLWSGVTVIAVTSVLMFFIPTTTPLGIVGLIVGLVLLIGPLLAGTLSDINQVTRTRGSVGFALAVDELAGTPVRATAIALISAGAMSAILSIGGARLDLERGVDRLVRDDFGTSEIWVSRDDPTNTLMTQNFDPRPALDRVRKLPGVRDVYVHGGAFLDIGDRRVRVVARPQEDPRPIVRSQVLTGDADEATRRIRSGGWLTLSSSIAQSHSYEVGDQVVIPTPTGNRHFRLAAITANYGWPSGTIVMNTDDYNKAWGGRAASALVLRLAHGNSPAGAKHTVERALGPEYALQVQTGGEKVTEFNHVLVQGLARIGQISNLVLISGILAIVAAMFAAVWQRRERLASLRAIGMDRGTLYRTLLSETTMIVFLGGIIGVAFGLYCQFFASRWTEATSGFISPFHPAVGLGLATLTEAVVLAAVATAAPAFFASRIAPRAGEAT